MTQPTIFHCAFPYRRVEYITVGLHNRLVGIPMNSLSTTNLLRPLPIYQKTPNISLDANPSKQLGGFHTFPQPSSLFFPWLSPQ